MIVSKITGGLGNQMFQYATGYALAQRAGLRHMLDTSWYRSPGADREFLLPEWWEVPIAQADTLPPTVAEKRRLFHQPLEWRPCHLDGYWQTERYFADYREDLLALFFTQAERTETFDVAIHVRGRDKTCGRFADIATKAYYAEAVAAFRSYLPGATFSVWSDDPDMAATLVPAGVIIQAVGHPVYDMVAMSLCSHQIISNSSFSWWAAWLNRNPSKRIVWPDMLAHDLPPVAETDYIPASW
jgi:hypothetical protein